MEYRVELGSRAQRDLEDLLERISVDGSISAAVWFDRLEEALHSLQQFSRRCPITAESRSFRRRLRHLLYGAKPNVYRIIYEINESRRTVRIVTVRHAAMDELGPRR
jgi:plasmid stabilization system protein ParE